MGRITMQAFLSDVFIPAILISPLQFWGPTFFSLKNISFTSSILLCCTAGNILWVALVGNKVDFAHSQCFFPPCLLAVVRFMQGEFITVNKSIKFHFVYQKLYIFENFQEAKPYLFTQIAVIFFSE